LRTDGDVIIDPAGRFYFQSPEGLLSVNGLSSGKEEFLVDAYPGSGYIRTMLDRSGNSMVLHSVELPHLDRTLIRQSEYSYLELMDLGKGIPKDELGISSTARSVKKLLGRFRPSLAAAAPDAIVLAGPNSVFVLNSKLELQATIKGEFIPEAISLGQGGKIYVVVKEKDEQPALWGLTTRGDRFLRMPMTWEVEEFTPPIIGSDGTVFLICKDTVVAVKPPGQVVWTEFAGGIIGGAVLTSGDQLLVSAGSVLTEFKADGERRVIFNLQNEQFRTPPVPTAGKEIYVATDWKLYCLVPLQ
jgi:hypothetical protein